MASSISSRKCGKEKRLEDRISCMPDNILHHILSFLPTYDAVKICILSKKWKNLWTGISSLEFSDKRFVGSSGINREMKLTRFVENVICIRDAIVLDKFVVVSYVILDASNVNRWISYALNHRVREIILKLGVRNHLSVTSDIFGCESLTIENGEYTAPAICFLSSGSLRYESLWNLNDSLLELRASICWSKLKVLHLVNIEITSDQVIYEITITCPILEEFRLDNCQWMNVSSVIFLVPKLEKLEILIRDGDDDITAEDRYECEIKVYAESLVSLNVQTNLAYKVSLFNLISLRKAYIDVNCYYDDIEDRLRNIIEAISNISELELTDQSILSFLRGGITRKLLTLTKLTSLTVHPRELVLYGADLEDFFHWLPGIEYLSFSNDLDVDGCYCKPPETYTWTLAPMPQSSITKLKSVELRNMCGNGNELGLVKFLLNNAEALKEITLTCSLLFSTNPKECKKFTEHIQRLCIDSGVVFNFP